MIKERLVVRDVEGAGWDLLARPKQISAFLGNSLNRERFFDNNRKELYLNWALNYCDRFLILIDDWEERYNYMVFQELDENTATVLSLQRGKELCRSFNRVRGRFYRRDSDKIDLYTTSELFQQNSECQQIGEQLLNTFQEDPQFRDGIYNQVFANIGNRLSGWRGRVSEAKYQVGLPLLARFLLEEIGATVFVRGIMGYPVEVYPGQAMKIVGDLYQGTYPGLSQALSLKADYGYIHLAIQTIPKQTDRPK